jgi:hypothetical protein
MLNDFIHLIEFIKGTPLACLCFLLCSWRRAMWRR